MGAAISLPARVVFGMFGVAQRRLRTALGVRTWIEPPSSISCTLAGPRLLFERATESALEVDAAAIQRLLVRQAAAIGIDADGVDARVVVERVCSETELRCPDLFWIAELAQALPLDYCTEKPRRGLAPRGDSGAGVHDAAFGQKRRDPGCGVGRGHFNSLNRRMRTRMSGGVGGGSRDPRLPPIPICQGLGPRRR